MASERSRGLCEGCLSNDRTLSELNEEVYAVYTCYILENVECRSALLCWECVANIQKFIAFKKRCLRASCLLDDNRLCSTIISSLSTIKVYTTSSYDVTARHDSNEDKELKKNEDLKNKEIINENFIKKDAAISKDVEIDLQVVKVEENLLEDVEECFVDDGFYQDEDSSCITGDDNNAIVMSKSETKNCTDDGFDCSDDEPLHNKRTQSLTVKRKKKKKQNGGTKARGRRGEAPAGVVEHPRVKKKLQQLNVPDGLVEKVVLSWEQVEEERQRALTSEAFTRHKYRCERCVVGFNHRHKMDHHLQRHHQSSGELSCDLCTVRFRDHHALSAHRRRHRLRWRCARCGGAWSRAGGAALHVARAHSHDQPPSSGQRRSHLKSDAQRQKCDICEKTFKDKSSLRTHLFIHTGEKEYSCPRCHKMFLFKKAMELHLVTHEQATRLYCHQCDVTFKNQMSYSQHMRYSLKHIHPDRLKYACSSCDKKFWKASRLGEHRAAVHLKITPIRCSEPGCDFRCSSRPVLRGHLRAAHGGAPPARALVCHACGKRYTTKKSLEGHLRSHTGERPFKCGTCPSTFGYEAALYNHNRLVHSKTKKKPAPPPQGTGPTIEA